MNCILGLYYFPETAGLFLWVVNSFKWVYILLLLEESGSVLVSV